MKTYLKPLLLAAALGTGAAFATPSVLAADAPAAERSAPSHDKHRFHGPRGHDKAMKMHHGGHRFDRGLMADMQGLNLSEAQRDSIHKLVDAQRDEQKALRKRQRELADTFDALDPAARDYQKRVQTLSEQAGKLASDGLRTRAELRAKVQAQLTAPQVQALQLKRAERATRRAEHEKRREAAAKKRDARK